MSDMRVGDPAEWLSDMRRRYSGNALGAAGASLEMLHDEVLIYNSYAIRDKLRALEFRFDSERRAWVRSVFEVCLLCRL